MARAVAVEECVLHSILRCLLGANTSAGEGPSQYASTTVDSLSYHGPLQKKNWQPSPFVGNPLKRSIESRDPM